MLTIEKIKTEFSYVGGYHGTDIFEAHGDFCDVYFRCKGRQLQQEQIDIYNQFKTNCKNYLQEIESYISRTLTNSEKRKSEIIQEAELTIDVIEVPSDNDNYDLVLVCGKSYKSMFFFNRFINIRVEFKNGSIKAIQRKKDTTQPNE
jgi:hypothetical protein